MDYLAPPAHHMNKNKNKIRSKSSSRRNANSPRMTSRSVSPCRRSSRASSSTPTQQGEDESAIATPQALRKRPPRPTHLNEIFRPRCNTDPSNNIQKPTAPRSALGSLLRQTLKVTSASVGFSASEERLTQLATTGSLNDNAKRKHSRSTSSVVCTTTNNNHNNNSGTDDRATTSMAPPQLPTTSPTTATATNLSEQELQQQQQQRQQQQQHELHLRRQQYGTIQLSLPETFGPQFSSLPQSYSSSVGPLQSSGSAQSLGSSPSPSPRNSQVKGVNVVGLTAGSKGSSSNTAKQHEQQSSAVAGISSSTSSAAAAAAGVSLNNNGGMSSNGGVSGGNNGIATYSVAAGGSVAAIPPEKEKKRKEVSSSRVKKFHRHFSQVSKDEKLINYFSCALVGDIPLQGHLYITEEHFAFYSNVFGYVTKVVIPTSSVTKISKEKTAKIIPNAVGVATADERHVFGSFISRESAFRLMCTVCTQLNPGAEILLPKPLLLPVDVELTEEYLLDDDSSCSISGNESPPQLRDPAAVLAGDMDQQQQAFLRQRPGSDRHSEMQTKASLDVIDGPVTIRSSAPPVVHYEEPMQAHLQQLSSPGAGSRHLFSSALPTVMGNGSGVSGSSASSSSSPVTVVGMGVCVAVPTTPINTGAAAGGGGAGGAGEGNPAAAAPSRSRWRLMAATARTRLSLDVPALTELQVLYLGITLAVLLAIFSVFLLYRVLDIEAKTSLYNMPVDFNARGGNDDDIFAEALRWQRELQDKSTAEAQHILAKNLEQISKVRRSLETLSMLIHDRRAGYGKPQTDMDLMAQNGAAAAGDVSD